MYYVLYFLAGMFAVNGVPHFIKGITGEKFQTPFARQSTALVNVIWGVANFVLAYALWHWAGLHRDLTHTFRYEAVFGLGGLIIALLLAYNWSRPANKSK